MINALQEILESITPMRSQNMALQLEYAVLNATLRKQQWLELSPAEKQKKRIRILNVVKKDSDELTPDKFKYENSLVSLYAVGTRIFQNYKEKEELSMLEKRVSLLISIDLAEIDKDISFYQKNLIPVLIYQNLTKEMISAGIETTEISKYVELLEFVINSPLEQSLP